MSEYQLIDRQQLLAPALEVLGGAGSLALDTEFVRERTYFPRLCLVQLADPDARHVLLVDPLRLDDLTPLASLLGDPGRAKLIHAARQDLEALLPLTGAPAAPVFDTQVAAGLLGFPAQVGYGELVRLVLGVELEKGHARTDWATRPLKPAQLAYAADDVRFLGPVATELGSRLEAAGRLGWASEDCAPLTDPATYRCNPEDAWRRFKGLEQLRPEERAVIRDLARWREDRAVRRNLPRGWILPDDAVREIARLRPRNVAALARVGSLPGGAGSRLAEEILEVVATARPDPEWAAAEAQERLAPEQMDLLRRLQEIQQAAAKDLGVSPEVLATRRDLTALVRGSRDAAPLSGWRRAAIGDALLAAL
ncbi:MAG: ribonuclease D [Steroidobacteraceae bacterium]|nr:ribonuclease D [Steroidobacteraceae bacterium]